MSKRLITIYLPLTLVFICFILGLLFFLFKRNHLIIQCTFSPSVITKQPLVPHKASKSRSIKAFFWKHDKWYHEQVNVIWHHDNILENLKHTVMQWLNLLKDEDIISRHINLNAVVMSSIESDGYLSFSHTLFSQEESIIDKWGIIESLIKTLQESRLPLHTMRLLVKHQEMNDSHLDLSQPIPLQEFLIS